MIPKVIHYCWFGRGKKSELIEKCIDSWHKVLPDYQIVEWNEDNFDVNSCLYVKQAYEVKKWAFVTDYVRLYALYECGGIYLDSDVEVFKSLDIFLYNEVFTGFEVNDQPITAVMGAEKGNRIIKGLLDYYRNISFINPDGSLNLKTNTHTITESFLKLGIKPNGKEQLVDGLKVYPAVYFCPNTIPMIFGGHSQKTYTIHYSFASWKGKQKRTDFIARCKRYIVGIARNMVGTDMVEGIRDRKKRM